MKFLISLALGLGAIGVTWVAAQQFFQYTKKIKAIFE